MNNNSKIKQKEKEVKKWKHRYRQCHDADNPRTLRKMKKEYTQKEDTWKHLIVMLTNGLKLANKSVIELQGRLAANDGFELLWNELKEHTMGWTAEMMEKMEKNKNE